MIYFVDDFLNKSIFDSIVKDLSSSEFEEYRTPGKSFYVQKPTEQFNNYVLNRLEEIENRGLDSILSFFRVSTDRLDNNWRIHSDLNIEGQNPDRAIVLYISKSTNEDLHGTALWSHKKYGKKLPKDTTNEEFDRMITSESENLDMWKLNSVIGYEQNRVISYPANYFHSKYPNKSWRSGREVFVMFYKFK